MECEKGALECLSLGMYFFRLKAGGQVRGEKAVMLK